MLIKAFFATLMFIFCAVASAQQIQPKTESTEAAEKLRKDAVTFLRETLTDVGTMRSLENRISFAAEIAGLMWFHDEREARSMYGGVIGDFRDLLARYDADMNRLGITEEDTPDRTPMPSFLMEPTDESRVLRKFVIAMGVRQQIAMSLAEHDPDMAFAFFYDSLAVISNPEFRKRAEREGSHFEAQLLGMIADKDPGKAVQLGARSLSRGLTYQHVELLKKIHSKNPEKGVEFGAAILSRIKSDKLGDGEFYFVRSLIEFGEETLASSRKAGGKRAVYSAADLRDITEVLAQAILQRSSDDEYHASSLYLSVIERHSPGRAAQIRAKFKPKEGNTNTYTRYGGPPPRAMMANSNAANSNVAYGDPVTGEEAARENEERQMVENMQKLEKRELPKEEREKIIGQARRIIMQTPGRDKKVMGLSVLAAQVAKAGDKDLAAELMKDAEALVNPSPKNYQDFLLSWMLASGYANTDPDRAFPLLEETIGRVNETIAALVKIGEFIDVAEEMVQDGEVQVGVFGGQMIRGLTSELGMADATIEVLARADFAKTRNLTNRFDRTEVRILAKMMVLRAVLDPKKAPKPVDAKDVVDEPVDGLQEQ